MQLRSGVGSTSILFALATSLLACGGSTSSNNGADAGPPDAKPGGPPNLGTPAGQWTWVPIDGTQCMNKSATGIGVNLGTSGDLLIYLEGGGACFNAATCGSVAHPNGFGASDFTSTISGYDNTGIFDRKDAKNPLKDATYVFVPYCTGDVHAGSNPTGPSGRAHVGFVNMGKDLDYLVSKSASVSRVILAGSSAGGFGAMFNYNQTRIKFGATPAVLVDDSGPPLSDTYLTPCLQQQMRDAWNLAPALPSGCTACTQSNGGGLGNAAVWLADHYKDQRIALITSTRDGIIRSFFGFGYPDCATSTGNPIPEATYAMGIAELRDTTLAGHDNFKVFSKDSGLHVWLLNDPLSTVTQGTADLETWLTTMLDPSKPWDTVKP